MITNIFVKLLIVFMEIFTSIKKYGKKVRKKKSLEFLILLFQNESFIYFRYYLATSSRFTAIFNFYFSVMLLFLFCSRTKNTYCKLKTLLLITVLLIVTRAYFLKRFKNVQRVFN